MPYQPTTTSYDYDAPLDEGGAPTEKYHRLREVIVRTTGPAPLVPQPPPRIAIAPFALDAAAAYADLFAAPIALTQPRHMESLGQSFGAMFYKRITGPLHGALAFGDIRDYAVVSVDATIIGTLDRRLRQRSLTIDVSGGSHDLGVFVESTGRINYGPTFGQDRKGLIGPATINGRALDGWNAFCLPMDDLHMLRFGSATVAAPAFYRGTFALTELGDTYLDVRMLGKGSLWVNGNNAGRFWHIGPQYSLFIPREWLRLGTNEVIVFDLIERSERRLAGTTSPIFAPISE
jgi:beta-galactosidase